MECSSFTIGMGDRGLAIAFFPLPFHRLYSRMDNRLQIERRLSGRKEEKKDDGGQHLRAGSKYRTTVHDEVNEKRMKIIINV